ncbi:MAG: DUF4349 domain-containing protein [Acidimicrobiia bacterium]|nr:DUF4349 domain-containing protein [Acidimicrobiia bacterium]
MRSKRWMGIAALAAVILLGAGVVVASLGGADAKNATTSATMSAGRDLVMTPDMPSTPVALENTSSALPVPGMPSRVVKTATLALDVKRGRLDDVYSSVLGTVESVGGFVASSNQSKGRAQLTMRIPASRFESSIATLRAFGKVTNESVTGEDVTAQFVDLESRIRNLRTQEVVLLDLMRQARTIQDSIAVQSQLSGVTQQIEQLEGQRRLLDDQSGFGTLTLGLAVVGVAAADPSEPSTLSGAWSDATNAALAVIGGTLVVLGVLVPLAMIAAVIGVPVCLIMRRRNNRPLIPAPSI